MRPRCGGCGRTFTGDSAFDAHRVGPYSSRSCTPVETTDGWRLTPGGWTNAEPMTPEQLAALLART